MKTRLNEIRKGSRALRCLIRGAQLISSDLSTRRLWHVECARLVLTLTMLLLTPVGLSPNRRPLIQPSEKLTHKVKYQRTCSSSSMSSLSNPFGIKSIPLSRFGLNINLCPCRILASIFNIVEVSLLLNTTAAPFIASAMRRTNVYRVDDRWLSQDGGSTVQ
jgi:hypothetical protein